MRSVFAIAVLLLSVLCASDVALSAGAPPAVTLNPQPEPPGVDNTLPPGPCRGAHGKFVKCTISAGATAKCKDGTYSTRKTRPGTCGHHRGVAKWLNT